MTPRHPSRPGPSPSPRVCVFGEALVDALPGGEVPGGAPFNVACHGAGFGLAPLLVTRVGRDEAGATLLGALAAAGVPASGVGVDAVRPSGRAVVSLRGGVPRFEIPEGAAFDAIDGEAAGRVTKEWGPSVVAFGTLAQRDPVSRAALHEVLSATKALRLADLNLRASWYDGKTLTVLDKARNVYLSVEAPGTIDAVLDKVADEYGVVIPLTDLLYADPYAVLSEGVLYGEYLGLHQAAGVLCHHLAFSQASIDWQVWIEAGDQPLPRKLVITYVDEPGQPQYAAVIRRITLDPQFPEGLFQFEAPEGATRLDLADVPRRAAPQAASPSPEPSPAPAQKEPKP